MKNLKKEKLTQERLHEIFDYNPKTGDFTYSHRILTQGRKSLRAGMIAGTKSKIGYVVIGIDKKLYYAHRLAWLYVYGYLPENHIDHIDRGKGHNWISNLREVSQSCNIRNSGNRKNNTSKVKGVCWFKGRDKWQATIWVDGHNRFLGMYKSKENAICARLAAEQCVNWSGCDSSSPAYQYVQKMLHGENNV